MHGNKLDLNDYKLILLGKLLKRNDLSIVDLKTAINIYHDNSFKEKCSIEWENMRTALLRLNIVNEWLIKFEIGRKKSESAFNHSSKIKTLINKLGETKAVFIGLLPCSGIEGDLLLGKDLSKSFFYKQLDIYNSGYWIAGYTNDSPIVCNEV